MTATSDDRIVERQSPWLNADEAAKRLRCSRKIVYRLARSGRLRHARLGGRRELRVRAEWLDEFLDRSAMDRVGEP
jgi:excisionase family DNA binding protein